MDEFVSGMREFFAKWYAGTISLSQAYITYAEAMEKAPDELSEVEKQLALLSAVMKKDNV